MKRGLTVSNEAMGAFIDAVYAIAVTILALELPAVLDENIELLVLGKSLVNYTISFCIVFALWVQHRRINLHIEHYSPEGLWLNAAILLLVCLIPRATSFVFRYGGDVTAVQIDAALWRSQWTLADRVDLGFAAIVLLSDLALLGLLHLTPPKARANEAADIYRSKVTISVLLILVLASSLVLPLQNRLFLLMLPACLMLEHRIAALISRHRAPDTPPLP